jgi:hypothetical protein
MNLHGVVMGAIGAVNPFLVVSVKRSTGFTTVNFKQVPAYASPVNMMAQVQPLTFKDLQQLDGINVNGAQKAIYINGSVAGVNRANMTGGDLVTLPDSTLWLVTLVLEGYSLTAGWTKAAITQQTPET